MPETDKIRHDGDTEYVSQDKSAEILQGTFKHYYEMAMDHHTKAATTSNILLIIVGAIIALVGHNIENYGVVGVAGGLTVFVIGLFGAVWVRKQHERYRYWEHIAEKYQEELAKIVPLLKMRVDYHKGAQDDAANIFGSLFARKILDRYLWFSLHIIISVIGLGLFVFSMYCLIWGCR
jgi:uncharacterized membrane protein YiaA